MRMRLTNARRRHRDAGVRPPSRPRNEERINLADLAVATNVLGPGRRAILWVQGCPRRCPGCMSAALQAFTVDREWLTPLQLAQRVLELQPLAGVTLVGGEPFAQAGPLATLLGLLRQTTDLGVVTYSGYTLRTLASGRHPAWQALLAATDLLIDGPYRETAACDLLWRGSANQRLHWLSPRYRALAPFVEQARGRLIELDLDASGQLRVVGIPEPGFIERMLRGLRERGVEVLPDEGPVRE